MYVIAQAPAAAQFSTASPVAGINAFTIIAGEPGAGTQDNLNLPGSNRLNGQPFTIRAAGYLTLAAGTYTSGATPIQFALYGANTASFAAASGNLLFSAAVAAFTWSSATAKTVPWEVEAEFSGDSVSGLLVGKAQGLTSDPNGLRAVTNTGSYTVLSSNLPSSVNFAAEPPLQFAVGVVFGTSPNVTGPVTASLTQWQLEA